MTGLKLIFIMAMAVGGMFLAFAFCWQAFLWHECFRVGHSFFFCLLRS